MSDNVNHPAHYTQGGIECIDAMVSAFGAEAVKTYCKINAFKYVWRTDRKNGEEDIEKADWYLKKYLSLKPEPKADPDKITLATAFEIPEAWMMIWAGEPDRKITVEMTYEDLKIIYEMVRKRREERESKRSDPGA